MVAAFAVPSFASVQNIKISGDVDNTFVHRKNFDFGRGIASVPGSNNSDREQNVFLSQVRLRADADLSDNVSATVGLINERVWENDPSSSGNGAAGVDINLAFVTLREMLYSPLTVVVGRQVFSYENGLVFDATGANNAAPSESGLNGVASDLTKETALDAVRAILNYDPLKLEFFYAKVDPNTITGAPDTANDDVDLAGIDAKYSLGDKMNSQVEAFFFAKSDRTNHLGSSSTGVKTDTIYVPGLKASTNILDGLNVSGEFAWQTGNKVGPVAGTTGIANQKREAYAAQFVANFALPVAQEYKPNVQYVYTWVTGDRNTSDTQSASQSSSNRWTAWDPFFENQGGGTIYNTLYSLSNLRINAVTLSANPMEDVTTRFTWSNLQMDKKQRGTSSSLNAPDGASPSLEVKDGKRDLGNEFDFETIYNYTEDVQIGLNLGLFNPGGLYTSANDSMATQAILHGNVAF